MPDLLISFYGDDFTGSTDAMESLARAGVRTVLFTSPPTRDQLDRYPDIRAFGVAGMTRAMSPDEMERTLGPALAAIRACGAPIVHYKVCSTFDSSPTIGSIGRAIDIGAEIFQTKFVPLVVGAPSLGRHCVFGNLFARSAAESEPYRLDRHPSMSRHPATPMNESDLRVHLARQTRKSIGLFDLLELEKPDVLDRFDRFRRSGCDIGLIDLLYERQLATVGAMLDRCDRPLFVVGSSGVESALAAHWRDVDPVEFKWPGAASPILAVCGSRSPVTAAQIQWALDNDFEKTDETGRAVAALREGRSVVVDSSAMPAGEAIGQTLGQMAQQILSSVTIRRMIVAGGDTSGRIATSLGIESMEMIAPLTRGAPLCRASAPSSPADGIEVTFKGGQIGPVDFFGQVQRGASRL